MSATARTLSRTRSAIRIPRVSVYQVTAAAIFGFVLLVAVLPRFDTDLWWHLFVGKTILQGHGVPSHDFLSYTVPGHGWVDHEWLAEAGMYALYRLGGFPLLLFVFGLFTTLAYALVYALMRSRSVGPVLALVLTFAAASASFGSWGPRVQVLTLAFAALFALILDGYRHSGNRWALFSLVGLMLLWSNLHGGFVVGLLLIAAYMVGSILDHLVSRWSIQTALRVERPLMATLAGCFLVTLVNPNTYRQLLYPLKFVAPNTFTNAIQESLAPNFHLVQMLPFELLLIGLVVSAFLARRRVSWIDVIMVVLFTHLALQQTRNVALWCIVVVPILAVYAQDALRPLMGAFEDLNRPLASRVVQLSNWVILALVGVLLVGLSSRYLSPRAVHAAEAGSYPLAAVRYLDHHPLQGRGFESYSYGGLVIWNFYPRYPVFIDSRADTVYDDSTLTKYLTLYDAKPGWRRLLAAYRVDWVMVEPGAPLIQILRSSPHWHVDFEGRLAVIASRSPH